MERVREEEEGNEAAASRVVTKDLEEEEEVACGFRCCYCCCRWLTKATMGEVPAGAGGRELLLLSRERRSLGGSGGIQRSSPG